MVAEDTNPFEQSTFPLAQAKAGDRLCIVGFRGDTDTLQHLNHLGFYPGAAVQVISRSLSGSVIVIVAGKRLGLGRQMVQQVLVCEG
jgi:Fe2+ transport system protein FeoA